MVRGFRELLLFTNLVRDAVSLHRRCSHCTAAVQEQGLVAVVVARVVALGQDAIKSNKSPKVQGYSYVFTRMVNLQGFGQVPD